MPRQQSPLALLNALALLSALVLSTPVTVAAPRLQAEPAVGEQAPEGSHDEDLSAEEELRLWLPFGEWLKIRAAAQAARRARDAAPTYAARAESFEQALTARAQLRVAPPAPPMQPTAEQLKAHLDALEVTRRNIELREEQAGLKELSALDLYLGDLLELERALVGLLERATQTAAQPLAVEGPPAPEEPEEQVAPAAERLDDEDDEPLGGAEGGAEGGAAGDEDDVASRRLLVVESARDAARARLAAVEVWRLGVTRVGQELRADTAERGERLPAPAAHRGGAAGALADLLARADAERELRDLSLETLIGLRASRGEEERVARAVADDRVEGLGKARDSYVSVHRQGLRALSPPAVPPAPEVSGEDTFKTAAQLQHAVGVAESFLSFHNSRAAATAAALSANEGLSAQVEQLLAQLRVAQSVSLTLDVIEELISSRARPVFLSAEDIAESARERKSAAQLKRLGALKVEWEGLREDLTAEAGQWRATLVEDQSAAQRLLGDLSGDAGLRARLEQERVWLSFLKEIESYDTPRLLEVHAKDLEVFEAQEESIVSMRAELERQGAQLATLAEQRERLSDPLLRQYPPAPGAFEAWAAPLAARAQEVSASSEEAPSAPSPAPAGAAPPPPRASPRPRPPPSPPCSPRSSRAR